MRCLEGMELLSHLQAFSVLPSEGELSRLPRLFTDDATMAEAAVRRGGDEARAAFCGGREPRRARGLSWRRGAQLGTRSLRHRRSGLTSAPVACLYNTPQ